MDGFTLLTIVVVFTAVAAWGSERLVRLPSAIGVMLAGLIVAIALQVINWLGWVNDAWAVQLVNSLHFDRLLVAGHGSGSAGQGILLGVLLFAAAIQIEPKTVTSRVGFIAWMATIGVVLTALGTGLGFMSLLSLAGYEVAFINILLWGVILAPTDPVAVLSLLKRTSTPGRVKSVIIGESLFNDGVSIMLFLFLLAFMTGDSVAPVGGAWYIGFLIETIGAIVLGLILGGIGAIMMRTVQRPSLLVLLMLAVVLVAGAVAPLLYTSCPLACVVAGLVIGRVPELKNAPDSSLAVGFWGMVEQALTAMLFLLIGLELLTVSVDWSTFRWSLLVLPVVVLSRFIALVIPWSLASLVSRTTVTFDEIVLMTWCGMRGGVSIAMAIAVPTTIMTLGDESTLRSHALVGTIIVVIGSILIQGLTVNRLARWVQARADRRAVQPADLNSPPV
ncbi:MAG: cation:proton antiporter [Phycisphaerales bacterium]|nr:cation:proton antiporter [Phycisphaerales bacterium]